MPSSELAHNFGSEIQPRFQRKIGGERGIKSPLQTTYFFRFSWISTRCVRVIS